MTSVWIPDKWHKYLTLIFTNIILRLLGIPSNRILGKKYFSLKCVHSKSLASPVKHFTSYVCRHLAFQSLPLCCWNCELGRIRIGGYTANFVAILKGHPSAFIHGNLAVVVVIAANLDTASKGSNTECKPKGLLLSSLHHEANRLNDCPVMKVYITTDVEYPACIFYAKINRGRSQHGIFRSEWRLCII